MNSRSVVRGIDIGKMNRRIDIVEAGQISDGAGGFEDSFIVIKTVWGDIRTVGGREYIQAKQAQAEITHKVTMRYTSEINHSNLLSFNGNKYDIQYIINIDEENKFLELHVLRRG